MEWRVLMTVVAQVREETCPLDALVTAAEQVVAQHRLDALAQNAFCRDSPWWASLR